MNGLLDPANSLFLCIDMQERLAPAIDGRESVLEKAGILSQATDILNIPCILTEQAPDGIGHTLPDIRDGMANADVLSKIHFNACREPGFDVMIQKAGRGQVVVAGMEAHVCVLQTVFGLIDWGYEVFVAADAVGSRKDADKAVALTRIEGAGARIVTVEMVCFEWLERSDRAEFRSIHRLVK